ncbi:O-antigen polysaccharide polymerase Wzy [Bradyrhizobium sp. IC3195]|uniref:O-antigen polysaccharide polymerase Wzy n=1 Tax=Bradyrhizobium sp. IC3195 TaxID=2793804 RepID=UPI001CD51EC4|nr:O-antigen polysaccharide polymerase Wzy [Bradyrhizobium sp. IC3195]MCA1469233.1 O-antigen polysaccharide polymerase Wzy [Bradyrhizobium sp. IC3195]
MATLLALVHLSLCSYLILRMLGSNHVLDCQLGVIALFSIGYFVLPVLFERLANLDRFSDEDIFVALLIHTLFLIGVVAGSSLGRKYFKTVRPAELSLVDSFLKRHRIFFGVSAFAVFVTYISTQDITSYAATDFEAYFRERSPFFAIIAAFGGLSLALLATLVATTWRDQSFAQLIILGSMFLVALVMSAGLGQRLVALTPVMMLLVNLYMTRQRKRALRLLVAAIVAFLFFSPFAIYLRELRTERSSITGQGAITGYSIGDNPFEKGLRSIVDRADLINVTIRMKPHIDGSAPPGLTYYSSVFLIPFPKLLIGEKPFLLSTDGTMDTELSVWAWSTLIGGTGSLTAFGGLVAYREGGWLWIPINGMLTGILFAFLARLLGSGGTAMQWLYSVLFVVLSVKKVPPSLFEALGELLGQLPFIAVLVALNRFFTGSATTNRRKAPSLPPAREVMGNR